MSEKNDGGPAFPVLRQHAFMSDVIGSAGGMSLRDAFAIAALRTMKLDNSWCDNPRYWDGVARMSAPTPC